MTKEEVEAIKKEPHCQYVKITSAGIMRTVQETFDRIEKDKKEPFFSYYKKYSPEFVLKMFLKDKESGKLNIELSVIPAEQYETLLKRYMNDPMTARIPDSIVTGWLSIVMRNISIIASCTKLYGRTEVYPFESIKTVIPDMPECKNFAYAMDFLDNIRFYSWAMLRGHDYAMSDFGVEGIYRILSEYNECMSPEDKLIMVNRCLDVVHGRGRIAHYFIEGGDFTCDRVSGKHHHHGPHHFV